MTKTLVKLSSSQPIGIFDSGLGGLTVAQAISSELPNEDIIYFGDTAHTPLGDKSTTTIEHYVIKICDMLLAHNCKAIIIACNTASSVAYNLIKDHVKNKALVISVIDPTINYLNTNFANKTIGLIGTKQTIRSNSYQEKIHTLQQDITLKSLATPLLVPLIEEGFADRQASKLILEEYLSTATLNDITTLILGCTHYPLLKSLVSDYYLSCNRNVEIIDSANLTAKALKATLGDEQLLNTDQRNRHHKFFVSDYNEFFAYTAKKVFFSNFTLEPFDIWE